LPALPFLHGKAGNYVYIIFKVFPFIFIVIGCGDDKTMDEILPAGPITIWQGRVRAGLWRTRFFGEPFGPMFIII